MFPIGSTFFPLQYSFFWMHFLPNPYGFSFFSKFAFSPAHSENHFTGQMEDNSQQIIMEMHNFIIKSGMCNITIIDWIPFNENVYI
jgi:hypothetical protein